ncbi:MAG: hypothetical protein IJ863_05440, partial [Spirochaetales bacterium]|nr:hypothetical protein [Spirochaetales bacterium]
FYSNPAALAEKGFGLAVPTVGITFYNVQKLVADEEVPDLAKAAMKGDQDAMTNLGYKVLSNLGKGYNTVAKVDAGIGLKIGVIGLGTNFQVKIHSLNDGTSVASAKLIPEINAAQTLALGLKFIDTDAISLSAGVSGHFVYKAYFKGIGGNDAVNLINSKDKKEVLLWNTAIMGGYAIPFDVGVTLGLFDDQFTIAATANNINGVYKMKSFTSAGDLVNSISEGTLEAPEGHVAKASSEFEVKTPWSLNFGVAFAPDVPVVNPVVTADLIDMYALVKSMIDDFDSFRWSDLLLHLNAGAEINLFNIVSARAGVNRGFLSVGAGIWLPFAQVDASYGWQEFGQELGDKPVDAVTIKFNLGYDKH